MRLADLIEDHQLLGRFAIDFEYFKIAENEFSKDQLLEIRNIVSTLFLAESYYDIDLLKEEFINLFEEQSDKQAVSLFLNWITQLSEHGRIDKVDSQALERIYKDKEEVKEMLMTAIKRQKKEYYQRRIEKGIVKGQKQGSQREKLKIARKLLAEGLEVQFIAQVTGLSEETVLILKAQLEKM